MGINDLWMYVFLGEKSRNSKECIDCIFMRDGVLIILVMGLVRLRKEAANVILVQWGGRHAVRVDVTVGQRENVIELLPGRIKRHVGLEIMTSLDNIAIESRPQRFLTAVLSSNVVPPKSVMTMPGWSSFRIATCSRFSAT